MIVNEVYCDVCGKSCKVECGFEYATLSADWGYGSPYDGQRHSTIICMKCYDKLPIPRVVVHDCFATVDEKLPRVIPAYEEVA